MVSVDGQGRACVLTHSLGVGAGTWLPGFDLQLNNLLGESDSSAGFLASLVMGLALVACTMPWPPGPLVGLRQMITFLCVYVVPGAPSVPSPHPVPPTYTSVCDYCSTPAYVTTVVHQRMRLL